MKIIHRITINPSHEAICSFKSLGIMLTAGLNTIEVNETHHNWVEIQKLILKYQAADIAQTTFSKKEKQSSTFLDLAVNWHHGYPKPDDDFGYKSITYDSLKYCSMCGSGLIQQAPFRLKATPNWGRRKLMALHWIHDDFFVPPAVWEDVFKPHGIEQYKTLREKNEEVLDGIVQLVIPQSDLHLDLRNHPYEQCGLCSIKKYLPIPHGFFPSLKGSTDYSIFKVSDYMGSGMSAFHPVIISQSLYQDMEAYGIKSAIFTPLLNE